MVHDKWFIGCTHFLHANILNFKKKGGEPLRNFSSLKDMDETMIRNWNSVVGENDYVYHLGDVTFQYNGLFNEIMYALKGKKRLIIGNHDKIWNPTLMQHFEKAELWKGFSEKQTGVKYGFTCTHIPIPLEHLRDGAVNVHAHIHYQTKKDPHYRNVCVEVRNFTPTHIDTIIEEIKQIKS